jgi:hypothetical protein
MRGHAAAAAALATALLGARARAEGRPLAPAEAYDRPRNGFSNKLGVGVGLRRLQGHEMFAPEVALALGAQFKDWGAVHGELRLARGALEGDLDTLFLGFAQTWEFVFGRVRPGLGLALGYVRVERVTGEDGGTFDAASLTVPVFLTVDLYQSDNFNVWLGGRGEGGVVDESSLLALGAGAGVRFKLP